jgi:isochorismate pyruvate lyase
MPDPTPIVAPADCADMPALRAQIDRVDRALVALIAERTGYIARAAEIKQRRDTVHDQARIEDVVAKVKREAVARGVPLALAEAVWRELIAQSIAHEFEKFDAKA